jgi:hypothetical protein
MTTLTGRHTLLLFIILPVYRPQKLEFLLNITLKPPTNVIISRFLLDFSNNLIHSILEAIKRRVVVVVVMLSYVPELVDEYMDEVGIPA